jgi:hypothetical protein
MLQYIIYLDFYPDIYSCQCWWVLKLTHSLSCICTTRLSESQLQILWLVQHEKYAVCMSFHHACSDLWKVKHIQEFIFNITVINLWTAAIKWTYTLRLTITSIWPGSWVGYIYFWSTEEFVFWHKKATFWNSAWHTKGIASGIQQH